ncbi:MAG: hypothetical protein NWE98_08525 [Candidatus Bathyarchaeota archaeon]|nr:hypothetical protein [Candidatus Bathyarchaeota archaeon]
MSPQPQAIELRHGAMLGVFRLCHIETGKGKTARTQKALTLISPFVAAIKPPHSHKTKSRTETTERV